MVRYSGSKGYKLGVVCKRTELTRTVIKLRKIMKWTKITEGCCAVFTII